MKQVWTFALAFTLTLFGVGAEVVLAEQSTADSESLKAAIQKDWKAWTTKDVDAVAEGGFCEGVGFGLRSVPLRDMSSLRPGVYVRAIKQFLDSVDYYHVEIEELQISVEGDMGFAWGVHTEDLRETGRPPEHMRVRFTSVHKEEASG